MGTSPATQVWSSRVLLTAVALVGLLFGLFTPARATSIEPQAPAPQAAAPQLLTQLPGMLPSGNMPQPALAAAVDMFLKLDGIEGESLDERHRGEIEIESFSWGESQAGSRGAGGGSGAGKVSMQDFHFTMKVSKASPKLMLACASGQHIKSAVLTVRKAGGDQQEYIKWTLSDVLISSYQTGGSADAIPTDQISLNFTKIEFEYKTQNPDGSLGDTVTGGWDLAKNKAA